MGELASDRARRVNGILLTQELEHTRKAFIKRGFLTGWKPNEMTYAERGKFLGRVPRGYRITIATRFVYPNLMTDLICHIGRQHELWQGRSQGVDGVNVCVASRFLRLGELHHELRTRHTGTTVIEFSPFVLM